MNVVGSLRTGSSCRLSSTNARGWFWHAFCLFNHAGECKINSIAELRSTKLPHEAAMEVSHTSNRPPVSGAYSTADIFVLYFRQDSKPTAQLCNGRRRGGATGTPRA